MRLSPRLRAIVRVLWMVLMIVVSVNLLIFMAPPQLLAPITIPLNSPYRFVTVWGGQGHHPGQFYNPMDLAITPQGHVDVLDSMNSRIEQFSSDGHFLRLWGKQGDGPEELMYPVSLAIDKQGNVYVAENFMLKKFTAAGQYISGWLITSHAPAGPDRFAFDAAGRSAISPSGNLYVVNWGAKCILVYSPEGKLLRQWGKPGHGDGEFEDSRGITIDGQGNVYVADLGNHRIQKFTGDGAFLTKWKAEAEGLAVDTAGHIFATVSFSSIVEYTEEGKQITRWLVGGLGAADILFPAAHLSRALAVDHDGNIFIVNSNDHVYKYRPRNSGQRR